MEISLQILTHILYNTFFSDNLYSVSFLVDLSETHKTMLRNYLMQMVLAKAFTI